MAIRQEKCIFAPDIRQEKCKFYHLFVKKSVKLYVLFVKKNVKNMKRTIYQQLGAWKKSSDRKPLILNGARQVGKTYILKEFGSKEYSKMAFFSLDRDAKARSVFEKNTDPKLIILALSAICGVDITAGDTLIFLDEIQDCPSALTALKFFCEEANDYHIVVAGSLLGISLHESVSFPVGKVDMLRLYPMSFCEFLMAMGKEQMAQLLIDQQYATITALRDSYIEFLRQYYFVGGMPEAVKSFAEEKAPNAVRKIQKQILFDYQRDFSKHAPVREVPRINMVWNSIPSQLARENKKFIYGAMKKGARATEFEIAIQWLLDAGLIYKVNRVKEPKMPLKFYEDISAFKLFMLDVGLMGAMADTPADSVLIGENIFSEYKGAFSELFVHNELVQLGIVPYYHSVDNSLIEIDFVIQRGTNILPIEVKAEQNVKSKSLKTFIDKNPELKGIRFSMLDRMDQGWMTNIPLYDVMAILA